MAGEYVHVTEEGTPFCRILIQNRPPDISNAEELDLLEKAFAAATGGRVLVEFDSPTSLQPGCLARIQFMAAIRDAWARAGAPRVTFLSPPPYASSSHPPVRDPSTAYPPARRAAFCGLSSAPST